MSNEVKHPGEKHTTAPTVHHDNNAQEFWAKNGKILIYGISVVVLLVAGFFVYKNYFQAPEEQKAADAMWKAEDYFRMDSSRLALNGDGVNQGFLKIISKYGSTKSGNLAKFYAASSFVKLGDFSNAIKHLKDFTSEDKLISVRATGLLADAYAETGKKEEAAAEYLKAGKLFPDDNYNSPEYLFRAGLLFQELGKTGDAVAAFKVIKEKYPTSQRGNEIDKYLARLGSID